MPEAPMFTIADFQLYETEVILMGADKQKQTATGMLLKNKTEKL